MHLYTREEIERGFATVRHHLEPGGRFAFDVLLPDPVSLARDPSKRYRGGEVPHPRDGVRYRYSEYFSYDPVAQIETVVMDFEHPERDADRSAHRSPSGSSSPQSSRPAALQRLRAGVSHGRLRRQADHRGAPSLRSSSPSAPPYSLSRTSQ